MCYLGLSPKLPLVTIWQRQCEFRQNVGDHKEQLRKEQSILFFGGDTIEESFACMSASLEPGHIRLPTP